MSNETMKDIIDEIHRLADTTSDGIIAINGKVLASRLEAAANREIGNATAMRKAIKKAIGMILSNVITGHTKFKPVIDVLKAALSAPPKPPRNCDLYECEEDAWLAFSYAHGGINAPTDEYEKWLFERTEQTEKGKWL